MNCNELHDYLDAGFPGTPPSEEATAHLSSCAACRAAWTAAQRVTETLASLPSPSTPPDLAGRLFPATYRRLERRRATTRNWGLALAASLVLGIGLGVAVERTRSGLAEGYALQQDGTVTVAAGGTAVVRIALDSGGDIRDVGFVVDVPAGVELEGHPGEQQVAWSGELKQGRNLLQLPIRVQPGASGILATELHHDGKDSVFKVHVMAAEEPTWWDALRHLGT